MSCDELRREVMPHRMSCLRRRSLSREPNGSQSLCSIPAGTLRQGLFDIQQRDGHRHASVLRGQCRREGFRENAQQGLGPHCSSNGPRGLGCGTARPATAPLRTRRPRSHPLCRASSDRGSTARPESPYDSPSPAHRDVGDRLSERRRSVAQSSRCLPDRELPHKSLTHGNSVAALPCISHHGNTRFRVGSTRSSHPRYRPETVSSCCLLTAP